MKWGILSGKKLRALESERRNRCDGGIKGDRGIGLVARQRYQPTTLIRWHLIFLDCARNRGLFVRRIDDNTDELPPGGDVIDAPRARPL